MFYWSRLFLLILLSIGILLIVFTATGAIKMMSLPHGFPSSVWLTWLDTRARKLRRRALAAVHRFRRSRLGVLDWAKGLRYFAGFTAVWVGTLFFAGIYYIYLDRTELPNIDAFARFDFPTIGMVYDANGHPLMELATEHRRLTRYDDIPPIVRGAIIATEDKNFFSHNGVDYWAVPRVLTKVRWRVLAARLVGFGTQAEVASRALFPQGGSTLTQQLARGYFLKNLTAQEHSRELQYPGMLPSVLSYAIGARSVNMLVRKLEEVRLSLWIEEQMQKRFGSKRKAKEEILARYASFIYMGNSQYGFATAADYYFGKPLPTFSADDADKAALLAGIAKSPLYYAPDAKKRSRVMRRRNQTLALMARNGVIGRDRLRAAQARPLQVIARRTEQQTAPAAAVLGSILQALREQNSELTAESLFSGRIEVYSTVDSRVQQIANGALEHGLALYEQRHPSARGLIQGSLVVLKNRDGSILAETGGRQVYRHRAASYGDFNRVTKSLRQPGSTMKPMVYLAAFRQGNFNLETLVPDEPISVPDFAKQSTKWIANFDEQFRGMIPLREALAESRNAAAVWLAQQVGMTSILGTSRSVGVKSRLQPYATTALGASEVNLLELANAYRTMASGIFAETYLIRRVVRDSGEVVADETGRSTKEVNDPALALIQEGLRGVVRMPTGTAHALDSSAFPIPVMGKTGTTNEFRDALFVGSTYGAEGITIAVRIGFDDNRSLGPQETGGRVALPVFRDLMLKVYRDKLVGPVPTFPLRMEQNINDYIAGSTLATGTP